MLCFVDELQKKKINKLYTMLPAYCIVLNLPVITLKTCLKQFSNAKDQTLAFKTDYRLMQIKVLQNVPREHSAILTTFIKLPFVFNIFVLSILSGA